MSKSNLDLENQEKRLEAIEQLIAKLQEGEASAREEGWLSADEVEAELGI